MDGGVAAYPDHGEPLSNSTNYQALFAPKGFHGEGEDYGHRDDFNDAVNASGEQTGIGAADSETSEYLRGEVATGLQRSD